MATISVDSEILQTVARQLLKLAVDPDDVRFTHGPTGSQFIVPDELAEAWVEANQEEEVSAPATPKRRGK